MKVNQHCRGDCCCVCCKDGRLLEPQSFRAGEGKDAPGSDGAGSSRINTLYLQI